MSGLFFSKSSISGLIISTMIAEYRSLPSTDLYSFLNNIPVQKIASESCAPIFNCNDAKHILLVDDAVGYGISMTNAKNLLKNKNIKITTYTVFTEDYGKDKVDIYCQILKDQFLPWSTLKRSTPIACCDIDKMRQISNFFYKTSGIYSRLCRYMAYLYKYDWFITPYINNCEGLLDTDSGLGDADSDSEEEIKNRKKQFANFFKVL